MLRYFSAYINGEVVDGLCSLYDLLIKALRPLHANLLEYLYDTHGVFSILNRDFDSWHEELLYHEQTVEQFLSIKSETDNQIFDSR